MLAASGDGFEVDGDRLWLRVREECREDAAVRVLLRPGEESDPAGLTIGVAGDRSRSDVIAASSGCAARSAAVAPASSSAASSLRRSAASTRTAAWMIAAGSPASAGSQPLSSVAGGTSGAYSTPSRAPVRYAVAQTS